MQQNKSRHLVSGLLTVERRIRREVLCVTRTAGLTVDTWSRTKRDTVECGGGGGEVDGGGRGEGPTRRQGEVRCER